MQHIAVTAEIRPNALTKGQINAVRSSGRVLAAVYGKGREPISVILTASDLARVLNAENGVNTLVDLTLGTTGERQLARISKIEMNPVTNRFQHVGLQVIQAGESRKATVTVEIVGEPEAVKNKTAILEVGTAIVEVMALPEDGVGHLSIDVSEMQLDDVLHASDLPLPKGVVLVTDPTQFIVSVRMARNAIAEADQAEAEAKAAAEEKIAMDPKAKA